MANDDPLLSQTDIERLFSPPKDAAAKAATAGPAPSEPSGEPSASQDLAAALGRETAKASAATATAPAARTANATAPPEADMAAQDIEFLLAQAEKALESVNSGALGEAPAGAAPFRLPEFSPAAASTEAATLDLVRDVELDLKIELGRTQMYLEDVLKLRKGSVVPLDKLAGDPVDIFVNGRLIARGEVLVLNDNFCVRVAELIVGANVLN
jgi:flagellar motor switch protein FliN